MIIKPDWEKSVKSQDDKCEVLETALLAQGGFGFATPEVNVKYLEVKNQKWLIPVSRLVTRWEKDTDARTGNILTITGTRNFHCKTSFFLS